MITGLPDVEHAWVADHEGAEGPGIASQLFVAARQSGNKIQPNVANSLKRLHQNLGHISTSDMARHLRLAGAGNEVLAAAKKLRCEVCERNRKNGCPRPSSAPTLVDFNQIVAVDIFSVVDSQGVRHEMMSVLDIGTGEQHLWTSRRTSSRPRNGLHKGSCATANGAGAKSGELPGRPTGNKGPSNVMQTVEGDLRPRDRRQFRCRGRPSYGGHCREPVHQLVAQDGGLQPRTGSLGQRSGSSRRALRGRGDPEHFDDVLSKDRQRAREHAIRTAARVAYFRCQTDSRLRRALLQRSRVVRRPSLLLPETQQHEELFLVRSLARRGAAFGFHTMGDAV